MKKRVFFTVCAVLAAISCVTILLMGQRYTLCMTLYDFDSEKDTYTLTADNDNVEIISSRVDGGEIFIDLKSKHAGKTYITVEYGENGCRFMPVHINRLGVITEEYYFGDCSGVRMVNFSLVTVLLMLIYSRIKKYRADMRESIYQYKNVKNLGMIIFMFFLLPSQIIFLIEGNGLVKMVESYMDSAMWFAVMLLPIAFFVSVFVTFSNVILVIKEGRSWRNMLGCFLGVLVCIGTLFPMVLGDFLQSTTLVDVHNEQGIALYIEMLTETYIFALITYFECILISTIVLGIKAARRVPTFDKDYILILGCQIKSDGTLTNLLKGRADRALKFAKLQKESTGKDIVFVPSGGQGSDEVISEGEAIGNYLAENGIGRERILVENESANTFENFRNSAQLIKKRGGEANIAFSTTNYHVFRSGVLATEQGIKAEGIGSKTKSYFWINAFVREFIATLNTELKSHLKMVVMLFLIYFYMTLLLYLTAVL